MDEDGQEDTAFCRHEICRWYRVHCPSDRIIDDLARLCDVKGAMKELFGAEDASERTGSLIESEELAAMTAQVDQLEQRLNNPTQLRCRC